ncbi:MAG TPA: VIT1/CCC1 transporter family protein [Anaerolineaceae bacterium]|nr:VIT1/CCC1 transporter family protein [Anaerolineaceae bacterium]
METEELPIKHILRFQQDEIDGHEIYKELAGLVRDPANSKIIAALSGDELGHYRTWRRYSGQEVKVNKLKVFAYKLLGRLFGYTFVIKMLEKDEDKASEGYEPYKARFPELEAIIQDEDEHEEQLIAMIDEESLKYSGSVVLGLNDALVELTGTLAGLTLAFQNTRLIALSGLITGIAAALSMAASEFLSTSSEETNKEPVKASIYTGLTYIVTVTLLILPYLLFSNYYAALAVMLIVGVLIIALFNFYSSVVREEPFLRNFGRMAAISLGVAALSFGIGFLVRSVFGISV